METLVQDVRFAMRGVLRQPSFALATVMTLALGIGAATAIFSVYDAILLRPLPFGEPGRIVAVTNFYPETGATSTNVSAPDFHDWKARSRSFEALTYYAGGETSVIVGKTAEYASAYRVTDGFFETLGVEAALGRLLTASDHEPGAAPAAVITDAFWRSRFNAAASTVGATVRFNDETFTIAGVLQPGVRHPARADIYYPSWTVPETTHRSAHNYRALGRLGRGVSLERAQAEMTAVAEGLAAEHPTTNKGKRVALVSLQEQVVGGTRQTLYVLAGAVGLLLLIACANVANLLLARSAGRAREMVVRAAVGAGRGRLLRQLLTESAVLALAGGLLGAWLARIGVLTLVALAPADLPRAAGIAVDRTALGFALAAAVVCSILFGLAPALQLSRVRVAEGLRPGGKGTATGAKGGWIRGGLVVVQMALAVVLVAAAGLLGRSLAALSAVDMGFNPDRLLALHTQVPVAPGEPERAVAFYRDILAELRALPDLERISAVRGLPTQVRSSGSYWIEGHPGPGSGVPAPDAVFTLVAPDYFDTMGMALRSGRDFTWQDRQGAPLVAVISEALAREAFPGQDPVGLRIRCGFTTLDFMTIVGVVSDVRSWGPSVPAQAEIYMPFEQHPSPSSGLTLVARTRSAETGAVVETIRRRIAAANPEVPVRATEMGALLQRTTATPRFRTSLLIVFAGVALLLALGGVYGVMAYTVSQRVPELGVRMALGSTPGGILRLVLAYGARLSLAGLALGVALSYSSGRLIEDLLFGITAHDSVVLATVAVAVAVAALAASAVPAWRAMRVDPMVALRAE